MLTFFYSTGTCSTAAHIALEEAGLPFTGVEVSWKRKVNIAELEAVNPLGQVPVLVLEGRALNQGLAILEFIAEKAPAKKLLPERGSWERTQALSWLSFAAADFQKSFGPIFWAARWTDSTQTQDQIKKSAVENIEKCLAYMEKNLQGKDYILGKDFSVVDAYLFVVTGWCKWAQVKTSKYPNITAYLKRIYDRPAVQKVLAKEEMLDFFPG